MGIARAYSFFKESEKMFRCPACHTEMALRNQNSFVCANGHCFDLSKYGYINFAPIHGKTKYTKDLFENRRQIFKSGFFDPLITALEDIINRHLALAVLDAGCGEGFFISNLAADNVQARDIFAMDIQKDAIVLAAKENSSIKWLVGDLANIPLRSDSIDVLMNVFAPANYTEFLRVVCRGGVIIKVIPGSNYLIELRECAKVQLMNKEYSNEHVLQCFHKNIGSFDRQHLFYQLPVNEHQLESLIQMTPMMFHVDKAAMQLSNIRMITVDVEVLVGNKI